MRATGRQWSSESELLAHILETLDVLLRVTIKVHSDPKKPKPKFGKPLHYPRPHERDKKKPFAGMPGLNR